MLVVVDARHGRSRFEQEWIAEFDADKISYFVVHNKEDLRESLEQGTNKPFTAADNVLRVSAKTGVGMDVLAVRVTRH